MKKYLFSLLFVFSLVISSQVSAQIYARGSFCSWGQDYIMVPTSADTLLAQCVYMPAGAEEMKFADSSYSASWGGGIGISGSVTSGASANIEYTLTDSAYYNVYFDSTTLYYNIVELPFTGSNPEMYVSGDFNGWGTGNRMVLAGNHVWQTSSPIALAATSYSLKFRNNTAWAGNDWGGATGLVGTAILTTGGGPNLTITVLTAGNYTFTFNDSSLQYSIVLVPTTYSGGSVVTTSISPVVDSTESVTITFHPYWDTLAAYGGHSGDTLLRHTTGSIYLYTGVLTPASAGSWLHTNISGWGASDPYYEMTKVDSNTYTYTFPDLRSYYTLTGTSPEIDSVALIFTSGNGDTQTSNIFIPLAPEMVASVSTGPMVTTAPASIIDSDESVVIHFHPYWDTLGGTTGDATLRSFGGTIFIYTGLLTTPSTGGWNHTNPTWAAAGSYYAMTEVDSNDYTYTMSDLRAFYGIGADSLIDTIKIIFKDSLGTIQSSTVSLPVSEPLSSLPGGPVVTTSVSPVIDSTEPITITFHPYWDTLADYGGHSGDTLLRHTTGDIYIYTGVLPYPTPGAGTWIHTNTSGWGASDPYYKMTRVDSNTYTYTFPNLRAYYSLAGTDTLIDSIAVIFTSGNGDTQTSNIFIPVTPSSTPPAAGGPIVTTSPAIVIDTTESVTITFHPYWDTLADYGGHSGDTLLRHTTGDIYIYTGVLPNPTPGAGTWIHTNTTGWGASDPYYKMTKVDSNTYTYTFPNLRAYYSLAGTDTLIDSIAVIFTSGNGDTQTSNIYIPVVPPPVVPIIGGPIVSTSISPVPDSTEPLTITFHPYWDTLADYGGHPGDTLLRHTTGDVYLYTGVLANPTPFPSDWIHTNTSGWGASDPYYKMTRVDSNTYTYTFPNLRAFYSLAATDTAIDSIALIFTSGNGDTQTSNIFIPLTPATLPPPPTGFAVTASISPVIDSSEGIVISFHPFFDTLADYGGHSGDTLFRTTTSTLYLYTGVLANPTPGASTWIHINTSGWGASDPYYRMTRVDSNTYTYAIPDIRSYYSLAGTDTLIDSIALIFSTGNGDIQTSNFFIPLVQSTATNVGVPVVTVSYTGVSMLLMPNPATNNVSALVSIGNSSNATIRVMNQLGQCVLVRDITSQGKIMLSLNDLQAGMYFVELTAGDKKVIQSLIKE